MIDVLTALAGIIVGSMGVIGFGLRKLGIGARCIFIVAAVCLLIPLQGVVWGQYVLALGVCLICAIAFWQFSGARTRKRFS